MRPCTTQQRSQPNAAARFPQSKGAEGSRKQKWPLLGALPNCPPKAELEPRKWGTWKALAAS